MWVIPLKFSDRFFASSHTSTESPHPGLPNGTTLNEIGGVSARCRDMCICTLNNSCIHRAWNAKNTLDLTQMNGDSSTEKRAEVAIALQTLLSLKYVPSTFFSSQLANIMIVQ
jgi:hypothetical protein